MVQCFADNDGIFSTPVNTVDQTLKEKDLHLFQPQVHPLSNPVCVVKYMHTVSFNKTKRTETDCRWVCLLPVAFNPKSTNRVFFEKI